MTRLEQLPRVRVRDEDALEFARVPLAGSASLADECRSLARAAAPDDDPALFEARLGRYEWALTARREGRLAAFILGQTREIAGERFIYLGPLHSTGGVFLPLFAHALRSACATSGRWTMAMELEHPKLLRIFRVLVPRGWPRQETPLPERTIAAAQSLAEALGHVRSLDARTLRTSCARGPAQLVLVHGEQGELAREIEHDLDRGLERLARASRPRRIAAEAAP